MAGTMKHELKFLELVRQGLYAVSENGDINKTYCTFCRSKISRKVPYSIGTNGHCGVKFYWRKKEYHAMAHRIVYSHFKGEIPDGMYINHIDGNPRNNALSNLEAVTPEVNLRHAIHAIKTWKSFGANHPNAKLTPYEVIRIIYFDHYKKYTRAQLAEKYGVTESCIEKVCSLETWRWLFDKEYIRSGVGEEWKKEVEVRRRERLEAQRGKMQG
ncbi:MAG: HNH endonuclease [Candidatus Latescibacterota bacterium]